MATKNKKIKGNKGEWSEFYAFLKLLVDRKLYAADRDLNRIENLSYSVLKIMRSERKDIKTYDVSGRNKIKISDGKLLTVKYSEISPKLKKIFKRIKEEDKSSFAIAEATEIMDVLHCTTIKASSIKKSDIVLLLSDVRNLQNEEVGFSIKSMVGGSATLLNAGTTTNFIYKITGLNSKKAIKEINSISTSSKIRDRLKAISEKGGSLEYVGMQSDIFADNLFKIDSAFPGILGEIIRMYFEGKGPNLDDLVKMLAANNAFGPKVKSRSDFYEYKIKNLLQAIALGMTPARQWNGSFDAQGGYIIVREDGELVCYHAYNQDKFREYLFKNTKLETASSSRHQFGVIYGRGGELFIKLNLQIRFLK